METDTKESFYNFKTNDCTKNVFFTLGLSFRCRWGRPFKVSKPECWSEQTWGLPHSETCKQTVRRENLRFPSCKYRALHILKLPKVIWTFPITAMVQAIHKNNRECRRSLHLTVFLRKSSSLDALLKQGQYWSDSVGKRASCAGLCFWSRYS